MDVRRTDYAPTWVEIDNEPREIVVAIHLGHLREVPKWLHQQLNEIGERLHKDYPPKSVFAKDGGE